MKPILALLIICTAALSCHALDNSHDAIALQCDLNEPVGDRIVFKLRNSEGIDLTAEQIAKVNLQYFSTNSSGGSMISSKGCATVPAGTERVKASISGSSPLLVERDFGTALRSEGKVLNLDMEAPGELELALRCPKDGLLAADRLENIVAVKKSIGKLQGYSVNLRITTPDGKGITQLYNKDNSQPDIKLPAIFPLTSIAEGSYRVELSVKDQFHGDANTLQSQCGLLVRRSCPNDEAFDPATISCVPKLCDNAFRIGAKWSESLPKDRGTGQYQCDLLAGKATKNLTSLTCRAGYIKFGKECLGATSLADTCALLENNAVACWGVILRTEQMPYNPEIYHDINIQTGFTFSETLSQVKGWSPGACGRFPDGQIKCWNRSDSGYVIRSESQSFKTWTDFIPAGFTDFFFSKGLKEDGTFWEGTNPDGTGGQQVPFKNPVIGWVNSGVVDSAGDLFYDSAAVPAMSRLFNFEQIPGLRYQRVTNFPEPIKRIMKSCFLTVNGHVLCHGDNSEGAVGANSTVQFFKTLAFVVDSKSQRLSNVIDLVTVGTGSTYCALLKTGQVYCWGLNIGGELANGTPGVDQEGFNLFSRFAVPINVSIENPIAVTF